MSVAYSPRRGLQSEAASNPLILTRWSGSGSRRLYFNAPDGSHVGWVDPDTGAHSLVMPEFGADFNRALSEAFTEDSAATYVPLRSLADPAQHATSQLTASAPVVSNQPAFEPPPASQAPPSARIPAPVPTVWAAPVGPPFVADLAGNRPGQQLLAQMDAAQQRSQRPTILPRKNVFSSWEWSAIGERLVAPELARLVSLGRGWSYLNSVPIGTRGSTIDHLVIGPGGVFTVAAKHHSGARIWVRGNTVTVNDIRRPYVRDSRFEAQRAAKFLAAATKFSIPVRGVVVPVNADSFTVEQQPADVNVVILSRLVQYLMNQRTVLDAGTIEHLYGLARLGSTWRHSF